MFRYNPQKTKTLAGPIDEIQLDLAQKQLVRDLADAIGPAIGLDPIPCHGLWLRAVREWQIATGAPATSITQMTPPARVRAALQIRDHFTRLARELLRSPAQADAMSRAIDGAYDLYMQRYNQRPA